MPPVHQCHQGKKHSWARGGLGSGPGTDSCGLSIQAEWRVVCQRDEKVAKFRSWTVCCLWPFPPGHGVALPGLCCLSDLWPLQGPPCQLSFIFLSPVAPWWQQCHSPQPLQAQGLHGYKRDTNCSGPVALHFTDIVALGCCTPSLSLLALCFTKWGTRCVQFPLMERHCHSVSRELDCQAKPVSVSNVHKIISVWAAANSYMPGSGLLLCLGSRIMQNVRNGLNHQFHPQTEFSFLDMAKK